MVSLLSMVIGFFDQHPWAPTFATITVTIMLAAWQINRQFRNSLNLQRTNKLDELHLEIYKDISGKIEECESIFVSFDSSIRMLPFSFENKLSEDKIAQSNGLSEASYTIKDRAPALHEGFNCIMQEMTKVISVMEKYEIAFSDFTTMKNQIFDSQRKLRSAFSDFYFLVMPYLPMEVKEEDEARLGFKVFTPMLPNDAVLKQIYMQAETYNEISMNLAAYLHDLRIESQNELISPIFAGKKASRRVPGDPKYHVLTVNKLDR